MLEFLTAPHDLGRIAFLLAVALAAGLARGFSGFGAALIFVPLASTAYGPQVATPLLLVADGVMTIGLIPGAFKLADHREVTLMALGAVGGVPLGVYLLATLDPLIIRWSIVVIVALLLTLLMSGWRFHGQPRAPLTLGVGLTSGVLSGAAQIGGPPVVAYWLGGPIPSAVVRGNIILFFAISTVLTGIGYIWTDLITAEVLFLAAFMAPVYGVALYLGSRMFGLTSERTFRRVCYGMIAGAVILGMPLLDGLLG